MLHGPPEPALNSQESAEAAVATIAASFECPHSALDPCHCITTVSAPNISSVTWKKRVTLLAERHRDAIDKPPGWISSPAASGNQGMKPMLLAAQ
jgi:hypothetical protein